MSYKLDIILPGLPRMQNPSGRGTHWAQLKKEKDLWKALVAAETCGKRPPQPLKRARLHAVRFSSICPDYDGLVSGFKRVLDALVSCGVLEDDSMEVIVERSYHWEKTSPKLGRVRVIVEEVI